LFPDTGDLSSTETNFNRKSALALSGEACVVLHKKCVSEAVNVKSAFFIYARTVQCIHLP